MPNPYERSSEKAKKQKKKTLLLHTQPIIKRRGSIPSPKPIAVVLLLVLTIQINESIFGDGRPSSMSLPMPSVLLLFFFIFVTSPSFGSIIQIFCTTFQNNITASIFTHSSYIALHGINYVTTMEYYFCFFFSILPQYATVNVAVMYPSE